MRALWSQLMRRLATRSEEAGTTLIDVVTSIVIMGVVISPIAVGVQQAITFIPDAEQRTQAAIYRSIFIDSFADDVATATTLEANGNALCTASANTTFATIGRDWSNKQITYRAEVGSTLVGYDANLYEVTMVRSIRTLPSGTPDVLRMLTGYCTSGSTIAAPVHFDDANDDPTVGQHQQLRVTVRLRDSLADNASDVFTLGSVMHKTGFD